MPPTTLNSEEPTNGPPWCHTHTILTQREFHHGSLPDPAELSEPRPPAKTFHHTACEQLATTPRCNNKQTTRCAYHAVSIAAT